MPFQVTTTDQTALDTDTTTAGVTPIDAITLAQALTWLTTNVKDLATAQVYLSHLTKKVFILDRRLKKLENFVAQYAQKKG